MRRVCSAGLIAALCASAWIGSPAHGAPPPAGGRRIAVVSAFDAELARLAAAMEVKSTEVVNGRTCRLGHLQGVPVVLALGGTSMVNAAMTAQALIDRFAVAAIVVSGIAGGVNPGLDIGDVTVPARWGQYQEQLFARETAQGWDTTGFACEFGNFGMMFPRSVHIAREGGEPDVEERCFWFPASPAMLEVAGRIAGHVALARCTEAGRCLSTTPRVVVGGSGVSGPTFVDNRGYREWVWRAFGADAVDMESAAVAHVAYVNDVPFIAFRTLSDLAGGGPGRNEVETFFALAADNSAAVVEAFLKEWAAAGE